MNRHNSSLPHHTNMSFHSMQHSIVDTVSSGVKVTGFAWFDMMLATLISGILLQYAPRIIQAVSESANRILYAVVAYLTVSTSTYRHSVHITATSGASGDSNGRAVFYYDDDGNQRRTAPGDLSGSENLPMILGALHFFQKLKIHFQTPGATVAHVQQAAAHSLTTRERLMNAVIAFIPEQFIVYKDMRFTFTSRVVQREDGDDQQNTSSQDKRAKGQTTGGSTVMSLSVEGNDLAVIECFLNARMSEEIDCLYPDPNVDKGKQFLFEIDTVDRGYGAPIGYVRSLYTTNKTFRSIFFEGKSALLQTLEDFAHKKGAWAPLHERPHKLVLLLEGLPGSGKTSTIKAIANMTKRHIILINAALIQSDHMLTSIFRNTNMQYTTPGSPTVNNEVPMNERLYVFEDLDCCGGDWLFNRTDKPKAETSASELMDPTTEQASPLDRSPSRGRRGYGHKSAFQVEKPTLSGMLNVLDGVCELNGVIIVLTTNKAELFDKALLRAGRVDVRLRMEYMSAKDMEDMLEYFYETTLTDSDRDTIRGLKSQYTASDVQERAQTALSASQLIASL